MYLHPDDRFLYDAARDQAKFFGLSLDQPPPVDRSYGDYPEISVGRYLIRIHHTPGHSPGGVCLEVPPLDNGSSAQGRHPDDPPRAQGSADRGAGRTLFVGDTLFAGSIGRTDLPGGDYDTLIRSITHVLFRMGDAAEVYPGHGPKTTIGQERRTNPFLQ